MTIQEGLAASDHAAVVIDACNSLEELDEASNRETATKSCPEEFNDEQRELVAEILLGKYIKAVGRA